MGKFLGALHKIRHDFPPSFLIIIIIIINIPPSKIYTSWKNKSLIYSPFAVDGWHGVSAAGQKSGGKSHRICRGGSGC